MFKRVQRSRQCIQLIMSTVCVWHVHELLQQGGVIMTGWYPSTRSVMSEIKASWLFCPKGKEVRGSEKEEF